MDRQRKQLIRFRPDDHTYWSGDRKIPGVTTVIETVCQSFAGIDEQVLIPAQWRGTAVHKATELDDLEVLDEDTLDLDLHGYLNAWRVFRARHEFEPDRIEALVSHSKYLYAGQLDRTGKITWNNRRTSAQVDIKTGPPMRGTGLQTAAYQEALKDMAGTAPKLRLSVHLQPDGTYKVIEYDNKSDFRVFLAMLTSYNWMRG